MSMLELFDENFIADAGLLIYHQRACASWKIKTEGFKELYEIFKP